MKISDYQEKIKVVFNPNIFTLMGNEKLTFEVNNILCPKVANFRTKSEKDIPIVRIFDSDDIPKDSLYILNDDVVICEKQLTKDELDSFGDTVFNELQMLFKSKY